MHEIPEYITFFAGMTFGAFCVGWLWFLFATLGPTRRKRK